MLSECEEIGLAMSEAFHPKTFDEALAMIKTAMPDEGSTIQSNVAEALLYFSKRSQ